LAAASILAFMATNLLSLRVGKRVQNTLIVAKIGAIVVLVAAAGLAASGAAPVAAMKSAGGTIWSRLAAAMLPVLFAIGGWQQGSFVAGAAKRPQRDVPIGILCGVGVVVAVYFAINLAYLSLLGFDGARQSSAIGADAAQAAFGSWGQRAFAGMVAVSAMGIMNTICMAPPYVLLAMAQEGLFPRLFARVDARTGTPIVGVLAHGLWAAALLVLVHAATQAFAAVESDSGKRTLSVLDFVCDSVVFVDWLVYGMCGLALLALRRRSGAPLSRIPFAGTAAVLFAAGAGTVAIGAVAQKPWPSLLGVVLVGMGLPFCLWMARQSAANPGGPR
jgi:APA family basic amino acid/polyamine antiporter